MKSTGLKKKSFNKSEWLWGYAFVAPLVLGAFIFSIIPLLSSFAISLFEWDGFTQAEFIGFKNFADMFSSSGKMGYEYRNTAIFTLVSIPAGLILSIMIASLLNRGVKGTGLFRVLYFLPNVTMSAAVAVVWRSLLNSKTGLINQILGAIGLMKPGWLVDPNFILPSMIIVSVWGAVGYYAVILLAGLQGISTTYYEAARIDGASPFMQFRKITLPLLTPSLFFVLIMSITSSLKTFDIVYMFNGASDTAGGPLLDASRTVVYGIYQSAFSFHQMGYASAQALILFAVIMTITAVQFKMQKRWVFYE